MTHDETIPLSANAPLPLTEAGVWIVEAGSADIFAVPPDGVRTHLHTVGPGQILCGTDMDGHGLGLLAVGAPGTTLRRLAPDAISPELIDGWLGGLFGGLSRGAPPRVFEELRPGSEIHLAEAGRVARAQEGVAWVRHLEGESRFLGEDSLALRDGEPTQPMPVPQGAWLVSAGEARIAASSTADLLRNGGLQEGLDRFHDLCLACVELQLERSAKQERVRLARKEDLDQSTLRGAYARLASVLEPQVRDGAALEETTDPLLAVCRMVGQAQGIVIRSRPESGARQGDLLTRICEASRVRARRVILREDWWRRDNGPLVGFRTVEGDPKAKDPVALLPTSSKSYELIDPVARTRTPVDAAMAETLSGDGFMFYPPLPERPVRKSDLLAMALRDRKDDLGTILLMGLCGGLLALLVPILTGQVFGNVIPSADRGQLAQIALALIVASLASAAFQVTRSIAVLRLGGKLDGTVQSAVWDRLLSLPVSFFRRYTVGDLASRSMGIDAIRDMLTGNVLTSMLAAVFSLFSFALLFYYSWRLALLGTALVAVLAGVTALLTWLQLRHQRDLLAKQGKMASLVFGLINGISKLRVAGAEARAYARWAEGFAEQRRRALAAQRVAIAQAAFNPVYALATTMAIFAVAGFSSEGPEPAMPLGEFLAFNAAFGQFLTAVLTMIGVLSSVLTMVPIYERLSPVLETVPEVDESKAEPGELAGEIEFSHVSFRYQQDGPLILDDVSFRAKPGEFIALVGPSGAGKSTCLRMILGFEKPSSGSIYYDGQDVASLAVRSVRRQIGVVLQTGRPMAGSIISNILGSSNLGIDAAWEAARLAGLEDDIKAMPMGMHTVISEGAETFSGGQKQRMLIARALVNRPRIILFDEATSALDNRTQDIVSRSLERLKSTRIVIAHRLSTIQNADRIYVMEGGRVVEEGRYDELIQLGGTFARLAERQIA